MSKKIGSDLFGKSREWAMITQWSYAKTTLVSRGSSFVKDWAASSGSTGGTEDF
jgi:hypothetical protein